MRRNALRYVPRLRCCCHPPSSIANREGAPRKSRQGKPHLPTMTALKYICTFVGSAACTFVGASQNTPQTTAGWVFLTVGSIGAGAFAVVALITDTRS